MFGEPTLVRVRHGDSYTTVRERVRTMLNVNEGEFKKYKVTIISQGRTKPVDPRDDKTVSLTELGHMSHQVDRMGECKSVPAHKCISLQASVNR